MSISGITIHSGGRVNRLSAADLSAETMFGHDGVLWLQLDEPAPDEIYNVAHALGIHDLVVEDAISAHQRAKMERYGDMLYVVFHPVKFNPETANVRYGELHILVGRNFVVTVRRTQLLDFDEVTNRIERDQTQDPDIIELGALEILHAIFDTVMDEYREVIKHIEDKVDGVEDELFSRDPYLTQRIYELLREVIIFQRATKSIVEIARALEDGTVFARGHENLSESTFPGANDEELSRHWRDILDHGLALAERNDEFRSVLESALSVHATLVAQEQNEEMRAMSRISVHQAEVAKKVSGWAAILFFPTLIAGIYGMNFQHMPELNWAFGYPFALAVMVIGIVLLRRLFKRADWI
ncbi:MAG: magnesium and cobalt transport protein CorA [Cellulomonadaceae bacterium]|nr:magnesium and cobalt transport protein CorA [Cellulomonadaceae bacterium]